MVSQESIETEAYLTHENPTDGMGRLSWKDWSEVTTKQDIARTTTKFPNYAETQEPVNLEYSEKDHLPRLKVLREYSAQIYTEFSRTIIRGEYLLNDLLSSFLPQTITLRTKPTLHEWMDDLIKKGIHIKADRMR